MAISRAEWADWLRSPVTEAVVAKLEERREACIEAMLNADGLSVEQIGLTYFAYRNKVEGMDEFLGLESLQEWICED